MARLPKFLYLQAKDPPEAETERKTSARVRRIPLAQVGRIDLSGWEMISRLDYILLLREFHQHHHSRKQSA